MGTTATAASTMVARVAEDARVRRFIEGRSLSRGLVSRFVAGESVSSALDVTGELLARGRRVSVAHLATEPLDRLQARDRRKRLRKVLRRLGQAQLVVDERVEVCLRLSALGACLVGTGPQTAIENARAVAESASAVGARVTVESEAGVSVDVVLAAVDALRDEHPDAGVGLVTSLRRTEADVAERISSACRVRLSKGYQEGPDAFERHETDLAYVRCLVALLRSDVPFSMSADDRRILDIADTLVARGVRAQGSFEHHLRLGVRPAVQASVADRGDIMRVYLPFGENWYPYMMARIADHPSQIGALFRPAHKR